MKDIKKREDAPYGLLRRSVIKGLKQSRWFLIAIIIKIIIIIIIIMIMIIKLIMIIMIMIKGRTDQMVFNPLFVPSIPLPLGHNLA